MTKIKSAIFLLLLSMPAFATNTSLAPPNSSGNHVDSLELERLVVSILGFAGTIITIGMAIHQYRRAEQWKRAEFVAKEVKDFENNSVVRNALP